ncbi:MAG TPA: FtsK/SpoIIIE domain-containing protein [Actinocrinis sp.]|uniref:FtsK/SpoIIIE domain-containing protein n=1 Tax=Actinocrinis sp. TaxID=1920516 RepID=UPI002D377321|nr:FtsK/SpoIIIE domain-containing protein [Actinocrinis sp.]HZU57108.1 FtsK/SpoIIIE domain-containing protein [Actinocrinis sp.]
MTQAARTADSMWTRLGRMVAESAPVVWFNDSVLHHPHITRGRGMAQDGWSRVLDVCYPLIVLLRGTRRGAAQLGAWWKDAPKDKRRLQTVIVLVCLIGIGLLRFGPLLLILAFLGAAAWLGRDTSRKGADPESPEHVGRLQAIYNGLVPYLQNGDDPDQHFKPGGGYRDAFTAWEFDEQDRLIRLRMDYSEYFRDGEADSRAKVERALEGKIGHANEYLYAWDEEGNHLDVRILPPLPDGIAAQPWPVADIEFVLGVTDPGSAGRLIPMLVADPEATEDTLTPQAAAREEVPPGFRVAQLAPVIWRLGTPNANPHLLLTGGPGTGKSTAVRSLLGQALARGHRIAVIDTDQTAEYGALAGRPNVLRITEEPADSLDLLDWFGLEIERRAEQARGADAAAAAAADAQSAAVAAAAEARLDAARSESEAASELDTASGHDAVQGHEAGPDEARSAREPAAPGTEHGQAAEPPLWLFVDDLPELCAAAARLGRPDPQDTLAVLARKARFARTTLVITARIDQVAALRPALRNQLTSRIALGKVDAVTSTLLFGGTLELGGAQVMPQGRGYARIGSGPVIRLQTPYAPALALSAA